jgi:hypothetical protein
VRQNGRDVDIERADFFEMEVREGREKSRGFDYMGGIRYLRCNFMHVVRE